MAFPTDYWLARAADARAIADEMEDDDDGKSIMLMIVAGYEQLAANAVAMANEEIDVGSTTIPRGD